MIDTAKTNKPAALRRRAAAAGVLAALTAGAWAGSGFDGYRDGVYDSALAFDKNQYTSLSVTIDGQPPSP